VSAPVLEPQFGSHAQQDYARSFGMWVFLSSELLFFGPLLFGYLYLRMHDPAATGMASRHTDMLLGTVNTAVLLTSSFCMALAGHAAQGGGRRRAARLLALTALLGVVFLCIKGYEWHQEFAEHLFVGRGFRPDNATDPATVHGMELFFLLYFAATGLHALHLSIGIGACLWLMLALRHPPPRGPGNESVELAGLYWHFVDVVWIVLYPLLYLTARSGG
jgi:cytochrome c oxidase subunit 3